MVDPQAVQKVDQLTEYPEPLVQAWQKSLRDCMASKGYTPRPYYRMRRPNYVRNTLPPGPISVEQARERGYDAPKSQKTLELEAAERNSPMTEEEMRAYSGITFEGRPQSCQYLTEVKLFGDSELAQYLFGAEKFILPYTQNAGVSNDMGYIYTDWAQCMNTKYQLSFRTPDEIFYQYRDSDIPADLSIKDATCREQVNYEGRLNDLLNAYMTSFLEDNQALIERITQAKKNAEENAPKILDGTL